MSDFYSTLQATQANVSVTENGAIGYKTTNHPLSDFNFKVASYRSNPQSIETDFKAILEYGDKYVLKYLFYLRDIREGIGERDLFKKVMGLLIRSSFENKDEIIDLIIKFTPEYGRWDDLFLFVDTPYEGKVLEFMRKQLAEDFEGYKQSRPISLLAKWLPSENASSKETVALARRIIKAFKTSPKVYRKTLSTLRHHLQIVETLTCSKQWGLIDYNTVPSKANIKYSNAFLRNDEARRRKYLSDLSRGIDDNGNIVKINSSVNMPHEVVHMYKKGQWGFSSIKDYDETIEQLWKNLKQVNGLKNTIVVRDDSGSMTVTVGGTTITALEIATALGIYCAEHNSEAYRNKIITFSQTPRYLDFSDPTRFASLHSKLEFLIHHSEVANTNIEAVFDLILKTAVENSLKQEDLPEQILIISDMEFDYCAWGNAGILRDPSRIGLFTEIASRYAQHGYKLPRLVFWNVNARTGTIPCRQNDKGVILLSGFSQNVLKMVESGKMDPYDVLIDILETPRYKDIPLIDFTETARESDPFKPLVDTPAFLS